MRLSIKDFGPLLDADFELKPLTVFIGPNNVGKTYVATLVHSIINSRRPSTHPGVIDKGRYMPGRLPDQYKTAAKNLKHMLEEVKSGSDCKILPDIIEEHMEEALRRYNLVFTKTVSDNFATDSPTRDLIRFSNKKFSMEVHMPHILSFNDLSLRCASKQPTYRIRRVSDIEYDTDAVNDSIYTVEYSDSEITITVPEENWDEFLNSASGIIRNEIYTNLFKDIPPRSFYLPSARSGIIQIHKVILPILVQTVYGDSSAARKLPGVIIESILTIINMPDKTSSFKECADEIEALFDGKIEFTRNLVGVPTDIKYCTPSGNTPIQRTSSAISDLALLVLWLRYIINKGDLLVIDEPEAHLHPENQVRFTKCVIRMIRAGIKIIITTHSPIILEEISNYLQADKVKNKKKIGLDAAEYIKQSEIAPYVFVKNESGSCLTKPVEIFDEGGINQEEFSRVFGELYNKYILINDVLEDQNGQ